MTRLPPAPDGPDRADDLAGEEMIADLRRRLRIAQRTSSPAVFVPSSVIRDALAALDDDEDARRAYVSDVLTTLGVRLLAARAKRGASQRDVAAATGLAPATIFRVEAGLDYRATTAIVLIAWIGDDLDLSEEVADVANGV